MEYVESSIPSRPYLIAIALAVAVGGYLALTASTVGLTTVQYDEFTDLLIASSLGESPLIGSSRDASQARLPMYVTAVAKRLMQWLYPNLELLDVLPISRWISISMSTLSILGTFVLGCRLFNVTTGWLAAALFAYSPYTLQFGRDALTQGDAFTSTVVVCTLIAFERFENKRSTFWLACLALSLALAIASKFYLAILIPALITYHLLPEVSRRFRVRRDHKAFAQIDGTAIIPWRYVLLAICTGTLALIALIISLLRSVLAPTTGLVMYRVSQLIWLVAFTGVLLSFISALKIFGGGRFHVVKPNVRWRLDGAWAAIIPLAAAGPLVICPAHIFNPSIVTELTKRLLAWGGNDLLAETPISARLYLGLVLFKLGLPFGIATCVAFVWAVWKSIENRPLLLITLILLYYGIMLAILPLQQPYWLMSVYPLITLVLSAMIVEGMIVLKGTRLRIGWAVGVTFAFCWLAVGLFRVYPTFGYYGYEIIGDRWLGSDSRGYRAVVVLTNDGSTEAIDWLRQNSPTGSVVLSYLDDYHIIDHLGQRQAFAFKLKHGLRYRNKNALTKELEKADFVIVRLVNDFGPPSPLSDPSFIQQFGTRPVYQVLRGRGIYQMPVIQIYQRVREST